GRVGILGVPLPAWRVSAWRYCEALDPGSSPLRHGEGPGAVGRGPGRLGVEQRLAGLRGGALRLDGGQDDLGAGEAEGAQVMQPERMGGAFSGASRASDDPRGVTHGELLAARIAPNGRRGGVR